MFYSVKDRFAILTGSSSGIGHALVRLLLNAGCWVAVADVRLRRESEATINEFSHSPSKGKPSAIFVQTDTFDWAQISALWKTTLGRFGRIAIVVNSTRVHEPPSSSFWNPQAFHLSQRILTMHMSANTRPLPSTRLGQLD
ncbi:hypothetical protein NW765_016080 [Fusarium oxysporum]|nr:hypothetical protein NW765_016080 [Fusarium oxysporum]